MSPVSAWLSRLRPGVHTNYMLRHHLWYICVCFTGIVSAITAINVAPEVVPVWRLGAERNAGLESVTRYIVLRLLDNGSQVFPIALMLGLVWAETVHGLSGRLTMVRSVGLTFVGRSSALFIIVGLSAPIQFLLDNAVRPYAFMSLSQEGLGDYGWTYTADRKAKAQWLAFGSRVINVTIADDPWPRLTQASIFDFDAQGDLVRVARGSNLEAVDGSAAKWRLRDGLQWAVSDGAGPEVAAPSDAAPGQAAPADDVSIQLSPLWLKYRGIPAKYIPLSDLTTLSADAHVPDAAPRYTAWLAIRVSQALLPGLASVCAAVAFALLVDAFGAIIAGGAALMFCYLVHFSTRIAAISIEAARGAEFGASFILPLMLAALAMLELRVLINLERVSPTHRRKL